MEQLIQIQRNLCIKNNVVLKINLIKSIKNVKQIKTLLKFSLKIVKIKLKIVKKPIKFNNNRKIRMKKEWTNNKKFKTVIKLTKKDRHHR
jgi:hypothetical protein